MKTSKSKSRTGSVLANLAGVTLLVAVAVGLMFGASSVQADIILVAHSFGGDGGDHSGTTGDLHGTNADTFKSAITAADGSQTWVASSQIWKNDGAIDTGAVSHSASLNMGSYINDLRGNALGKFTLSAKLSEVESSTTTRFIGVTFFAANSPSTDKLFTNADAEGMGTIIYRKNGNLVGFGGPLNNNTKDGPVGQSGDQLLTIVLDLTPAGGYNGTDNFGTVSFFQGDGTGTAFGSYTHSEERSFGSIGLTAAPGVSGTVGDFQLTQIPEPSTLVLLGLSGLVALFGYRRRRM